ncbi:MAG TPA: flagellar basal body protein [Caulobacteraceae bacterium]|nr:flagellar basal body protein [Caulobacteraceae bacterium]
MTLDDIPLFSALKGRLGYLNQREAVISQNVANSDTPGFRPQDLAPFTIAQGGIGGQLQMAQTNAADLAGEGGVKGGPGGSQTWTPKTSPDSETRLDGNQVVLEEEMMKLTDARMNYTTAIGFYEKSLNMIQLALKAPGKP